MDAEHTLAVKKDQGQKTLTVLPESFRPPGEIKARPTSFPCPSTATTQLCAPFAVPATPIT